MAHLVNFMGTDTVEALFAAEEFYGADGPIAFSIPASEHSTITAWGKDNEVKAFENMIDTYGGDGKIFACVSDSYDIYNAVTNIWCKELKEKIINNGGTLVVRPDSGDPVDVAVWVVDELCKNFGYSVNSKGFKVLPSCVRVIQGDGVTPITIRKILSSLMTFGYSAENIAFGMGGALLQRVNRDTLRFAMKTNAIKIDDKWVDVYKKPVNMDWKKSKAGRLSVVRRENEIVTIRQNEVLPNEIDFLTTVWKNGHLIRDMTFDEVRANAVL